MVDMKPNKIKARKMWKSANGYYHATKKVASLSTYDPKPDYVLPADAESVERMVEQMAEGILSVRNGAWTTVDLARAALAAIGIKGGAK